MVRAAATGMIDFRQYDPWDTWWKKKLRWVLDELDLQQTMDVCRLEHNHWITLAAKPNLTPESFELVKTNASAKLNQFLKAAYPWLADEIGASGEQTDRDAAVAAYQAEMGKPGDPHYEIMVDTLTKALARGPLTQREKERDRARRQAARAAAAHRR